MAYVFLGLFLISLVICFCVFIYFKWFKGKYDNNNNNNNNNNSIIIIIKYTLIIIKINIKSLKIKNESMFYPNDMIQLNNFNSKLLKINKRENRENNNIYYISYKINKPEHDINSINNLCLVVDHLCGMIEKINGSKDRYLVINEDSLVGKNISFFYLWDSNINKTK